MWIFKQNKKRKLTVLIVKFNLLYWKLEKPVFYYATDFPHQQSWFILTRLNCSVTGHNWNCPVSWQAWQVKAKPPDTGVKCCRIYQLVFYSLAQSRRSHWVFPRVSEMLHKPAVCCQDGLLPTCLLGAWPASTSRCAAAGPSLGFAAMPFSLSAPVMRPLLMAACVCVCLFVSCSQKLDSESWRPTSNWTNWGRWVRTFSSRVCVSVCVWPKPSDPKVWFATSCPPLCRAHTPQCSRGGASWRTTWWHWRRSDWSTRRGRRARPSEKVWSASVLKNWSVFQSHCRELLLLVVSGKKTIEEDEEGMQECISFTKIRAQIKTNKKKTLK